MITSIVDTSIERDRAAARSATIDHRVGVCELHIGRADQRIEQEDLECVSREERKILPSHCTALSKWLLASGTNGAGDEEENEKRMLPTIYEMEGIRGGHIGE